MERAMYETLQMLAPRAPNTMNRNWMMRPDDNLEMSSDGLSDTNIADPSTSVIQINKARIEEARKLIESQRCSGGFKHFLAKVTCAKIKEFMEANPGLSNSDPSAEQTLQICRTMYNSRSPNEKRKYEQLARDKTKKESRKNDGLTDTERLYRTDFQLRSGETAPGMPLSETPFYDCAATTDHNRFSRLTSGKLCCPHCPPTESSFRRAQDYFSHITTHHQCVHLFSCHHCSTAFPTKDGWLGERHRERCSGFSNDVQNQEFTSDMNYGYQLLACGDCGAHFVYCASLTGTGATQWKSLLAFHANHSGSNLVPIQMYSQEPINKDVVLELVPSFAKKLRVSCDDCQIPEFKDMEECEKHFSERHAEISTYVCPECDKQFVQEALYKLHILTHMPDYSASACCLADFVKNTCTSMKFSEGIPRLGGIGTNKNDRLWGGVAELHLPSVDNMSKYLVPFEYGKTSNQGNKVRKNGSVEGSSAVAQELMEAFARAMPDFNPVDYNTERLRYCFTGNHLHEEVEGLNDLANDVCRKLSICEHSGYPGCEILESLLQQVTVQCTIQLKNADVSFNPRPTGVRDRFYFCQRCHCICEGKKRTILHLTECCPELSIGTEGSIVFDLFDITVVSTLVGQSRLLTDERLWCPLPDCKDSSCSVVGFRSHLVTAHGIFAGVSLAPTTEYPMAVGFGPNDIVRSTNVVCMLEAGGQIKPLKNVAKERKRRKISEARPNYKSPAHESVPERIHRPLVEPVVADATVFLKFGPSEPPLKKSKIRVREAQEPVALPDENCAPSNDRNTSAMMFQDALSGLSDGPAPGQVSRSASENVANLWAESSRSRDTPEEDKEWNPNADEKMPDICPFCDLRINDRSNMISHLKAHPEDKLVCYLCSIPSRQESFEKLQRHIQYLHCMDMHLDQGEHRQKCSSCEKVQTNSDIVSHLMYNCKSAPCGMCGEKNMLESVRKEHQSRVHGLCMQRFGCATCRMMFPTYQGFSSHSCSLQRRHYCDHCPTTPSIKADVVQHYLDRHTGNDSICLICQRHCPDLEAHGECHHMKEISLELPLLPLAAELKPLLRNVVIDSANDGQLRVALQLLFGDDDTDRFFESTAIDEVLLRHRPRSDRDDDDGRLVIADDDVMDLDAAISVDNSGYTEPRLDAMDTSPAVEVEQDMDVVQHGDRNGEPAVNNAEDVPRSFPPPQSVITIDDDDDVEEVVPMDVDNVPESIAEPPSVMILPPPPPPPILPPAAFAVPAFPVSAQPQEEVPENVEPPPSVMIIEQPTVRTETISPELPGPIPVSGIVDDGEDVIVIQEDIARVSHSKPSTSSAQAPAQSSSTVWLPDDDDDEIQVAEPSSVVNDGAGREKTFRCGSCSHSFYNQRSLELHQKREHARDVSVQAPLVPEDFGLPYDIITYLCPNCCAAFESRSVFKKHMDVHDACLREQKYKFCVFCSGYQAENKDAFAHFEKHKRCELRFECVHCKPIHQFEQESQLMHHLVHAHQVELYFFCKRKGCHLGTSNAQTVWEHINECWHGAPKATRPSAERMGVVCASEIMFQPANVPAHKQKLKENPKMFTKVSPCSHRTMTRFGDSFTTCTDQKRYCYGFVNGTRWRGMHDRASNPDIDPSWNDKVSLNRRAPCIFSTIIVNPARPAVVTGAQYPTVNPATRSIPIHNTHSMPVNANQGAAPLRNVRPGATGSSNYVPVPNMNAAQQQPQRHIDPITNGQQQQPPTVISGLDAQMNLLSQQPFIRPMVDPRRVPQSQIGQPRPHPQQQQQQHPPTSMQQPFMPNSGAVDTFTLPLTALQRLADAPSTTSSALPRQGAVASTSATITRNVGSDNRRVDNTAICWLCARQFGPMEEVIVPVSRLREITNQALSIPHFLAKRMHLEPLIAQRIQEIKLTFVLMCRGHFGNIPLSIRQIRDQPAMYLNPSDFENCLLTYWSTKQATLQSASAQTRAPPQRVVPPVDIVMHACSVCAEPANHKMMVSIPADKSLRSAILNRIIADPRVIPDHKIVITQKFNQRAPLYICMSHVNPATLYVEKGQLVHRAPQIADPSHFYFDYFSMVEKIVRNPQQLKSSLDSFRRIMKMKTIPTGNVIDGLNAVKTANVCKAQGCEGPIVEPNICLHETHDKQCSIYMCDSCGVMLSDEKTLVKHIMSTHLQDVAQRQVVHILKCPFPSCKSPVFDAVMMLRRHINTEHLSMLPAFSDFCASRFADRILAQRHDASHKENISCCYLCGLGEPWSEPQEDTKPKIGHELVHGMNIQMRCRCCTYRVDDGTIQTLMSHFLHRHTERKQTGMCCLKCGVVEATPAAYEKHIVDVHLLVVMRARLNGQRQLVISNGNALNHALGIPIQPPPGTF